MINPLARYQPFIKANARYSLRGADQDTAEILLYDEIGAPGVTAGDFAADLDAIEAKTIMLRLNTPGGNVFEGLAIFNALQRHPARIEVYVDGLAASAGSLIAMVGDSITVAENAFLMIHRAWALVIGNANDMSETADTLRQIDDTLAKTYAKRSGVSESHALSIMDSETWLTAEDALELGFADQVGENHETKAQFDLSVFAHVPGALNRPVHPIYSQRELENFLHKEGKMPKRAAKKIASVGSAALDERDAHDSGIGDLVRSITDRTDKLQSLVRSIE